MMQLNARRRNGLLATVFLGAVVLSGGCGEEAATPERLIAEARRERDGGNRRTAIIHLKNLLQQHPEHAEARYLLGVIYSDAGDFAAAEWPLRKALELQYEPTKVVPALGKALLMTGEYQNVLDQVRLEGDAPGEAQAAVLTIRALAWIGLGRTRDARELLEQALAMRPEFVDARLAQAQLAAIEKRPAEAAGLIEHVLAGSPNNVDAWRMKGDLSRTMRDGIGAMGAYGRVLELKPDDIPARLKIASLYVEGGDIVEARKQAAQIRKAAPNSPAALYVEALIAFHEQDLAVARAKMLQVISVAPYHMPSLLLQGAIEFALGSYGSAQSHLGRVLDSAPDNLYARTLLVASLMRSGQLQRALEALEAGLKQFPENAALMSLAGEIYLQGSEFAKAAHFFEKAATLQPGSARARAGLAMSRLGSGEMDLALVDLEATSQLDTRRYQADILLVASHLRQANYDAALAALQALEKKQPRNPLTHNLKALAQVGRKDVVAARASLEQALALEPAYVPAAANLAELELQANNPRAARRRLETILQVDENNPQALLTLAGLGPRIGATHKEQLDWLERASKASPGLAQPRLMLARLHARVGDTSRALASARQAQGVSPDNPEVLNAVGALQIAAGQKEEALVTYHRLVTLQPASAAALVRLAGAQAANSEQAAAAKTLTKALSLKPDYIDALVALAELHVGAGRFAEAMSVARRVQGQADRGALGLVLEGDVLMAERKYLQAARAYEAAFGAGTNGALVIKLHAAYTRAGKPDEAGKRLEQWLLGSPDDANVRMYAAELELRDGRYRSAIAHYEHVLPRMPENVIVLNNLALAYHQVKDPRALETAERAYRLAPDNHAVADTLGWMLVEQGNTARGLSVLQRAVASSPAAHEARYHLAEAWLRIGDAAKARAELERLLASNASFPQRTQATILLRRLKE